MVEPTPSSSDETSAGVLDIAIVGSGPAGGAAALELGGRGLRVAVFDKATPPRYKTCGGGVLWRARRLLPIDIGGAVARECHVAELVHHHPDLRFVCRREFPIISMVMRDEFDHLLVRTAATRGVQLFAGTAVTGASVEPGHVALATSRGTFRARFVIAADGVNSVIARSAGLPALRGVVPAIECESRYPLADMERLGQTGRFDFGLVPAGYGWVFPKRDHLSIGVGTTRRGGVNLNAAYERYLDALGLGPARDETRHGYMIPCEPRQRLFDAPRLLLTGDAAGLADPVTAEGISAAILSGQLAARAITEGRFDDTTVRKNYRRALNDALLADLRVARWLAWLLYEKPRWCAALLSRHGHGMSELMARIVTGETTYRAAVSRPAHYLRLLFGKRRRG